jgi:hypothetical protein
MMTSAESIYLSIKRLKRESIMNLNPLAPAEIYVPPVTHAQHGPFLFTTKSIGRGMGGVPSIPDEETKTDYRALGSFLYMCC